MTSELHHLVAAYALDALDASERDEFERHLASCGDCRAELASFAPVAARLAEASATVPPADLKGRVIDAIGSTEQAAPLDGGSTTAGVTALDARRGTRVRPLAWLASAAAVALLVVAAVVIVGQRDGADDVDDLRAAPDAVARTLDVVAGDVGSIEVIWSPTRGQVALVATGVATPGDGSVYELWAIAGGTPVPAGLFVPADGAIREVVDLGDVDPEAWGITIEPARGSPVPTGDILYFAEV